jgi:hypothetical protein
MRILVASLLMAAACGGPKTKNESAIVEGADVPATCCCKTVPETAEKEIVPVYAMVGRMECSSQHGDCVPDVQCNGSKQPASAPPGAKQDTGVPAPPDLEPSK